MLLQPLVMSKQHWDKLTPAQKKIFDEAAAKSDEYFLKLQQDAVDKMEAAYKKAGAKVHDMNQAEYCDGRAVRAQRRMFEGQGRIDAYVLGREELSRRSWHRRRADSARARRRLEDQVPE
jgi:TRAP-type C4-dicarboxylate transport system substrate-binding protein